MTDPSRVTLVEADAWLARFVLHRSHVRSNQTVKPDAFIPHPWPNLSLTRHGSLDENGIWSIGSDVAAQTDKTLYGRADLRAEVFMRENLRVAAAPVAGNPNHVNVMDWPAGKPAQKSIAQLIVASATYVSKPPSDAIPKTVN
jgi:hypothetical protein